MKWLQLMLGAMLTNGFALLGLKVLAEAGLGDKYQSHYLAAWYASGLAIAIVYSIRGFALPTMREILLGAAMSSASFTGQMCLSMALSGGAPGYLVYPIGAAPACSSWPSAASSFSVSGSACTGSPGSSAALFPWRFFELAVRNLRSNGWTGRFGMPVR